MTIIIGMGVLSVGSSVVSMILRQNGKQDHAAMVDVATTCLMVGTVVTAISGAFAKAASIGK